MSSYLADRRKQVGLTQKEVADAVGVSEATVSRWESGEIANMRRDRIAALAKVLGCSTDFVMTGNAEKSQSIIPPGFDPLPRTVKRPLVGDIACGEPITAEQNITDYLDVPEEMRCDFCLKCHGDSMVDAGIRDGDIVYIRIQPSVEDGEIAAVRISGEATLKRVYYDGTSITLVPANSAYRPKTYSGAELEDIQIEGKVVGFTRWF